MLSKQSRAHFWLAPAQLSIHSACCEPLPAMRVKWRWACRAFDPRQMHWLLRRASST